MEQDNIKDLEKYISFSKKSYNFSHDTDWKWNKELGEKIEHLIKAYKELKENSIPVSLVEEKIEEYNQRIEKYYEYKEQGKETDVEFYENITNIEIVRILQKLLEKRK